MQFKEDTGEIFEERLEKKKTGHLTRKTGNRKH